MQTSNNKSKRTSQMTLNAERREEVNVKGSLYILDDMIKERKIKITTSEIMSTIPKYLPLFTENQQFMFKAFYLKQMSIQEIRQTFGIKRLSDVERPLKSATEKYLKLIAEMYGCE